MFPPPIVHKVARGITRDEHSRIIEREPNPERRDFYDFLWFTGASQSDGAILDNADVDRERRCRHPVRHAPAYLHEGLHAIAADRLAVVSKVAIG